jgi:adenylate kinase
VIIIFIGPPGSGKGTQAALVADKLKIAQLSTGEVLRRKTESSEGKKLQEMMAQGKLVPSETVNQLVLEALNNNKFDCILDGYPRNLEQVEFLAANYKDKIAAIYFDIDQNLITQRISGRFSCKKCAKIYNKYFNDTKIEGVCDYCKSNDFVFRGDDNEKAVIKRLEEYEKETRPVIEYYKALGSLKSIDASKEANKITEELLLLLKK